MYLSYDEYTNYSDADVDESTFDKLEKKAEIQIDEMTSDLYQYHDLQDELNSDVRGIQLRARSFKQSIAMTIDFMNEYNVTSRADIATEYTGTVAIGRTRIEAPNLKGSTIGGYVVPVEASRLLARYGLLYRGL